MEKSKLKHLANTLADKFISDADEFSTEFDKIKDKIESRKDGFILLNLAQFYYNIKSEKQQGKFDREKAIIEQEKIFAQAEILNL